MNTLFKTITTATLAFGIFIIADNAEAAPKITAQKAQEIAISHANIPLKEVTFTEIKFDDDFMSSEYEIEFFHNNVEYEYEIDADSGKVKSYSQEKHGAMQQNQGNNYITKEQAEQIAFKHAKVSSAPFSKVDFDVDDGMAIYDVEFYSNNAKYDYEINAVNSEIIKFEKE